jgi:hypothetical protein
LAELQFILNLLARYGWPAEFFGLAPNNGIESMAFLRVPTCAQSLERSERIGRHTEMGQGFTFLSFHSKFCFRDHILLFVNDSSFEAIAICDPEIWIFRLGGRIVDGNCQSVTC